MDNDIQFSDTFSFEELNAIKILVERVSITGSEARPVAILLEKVNWLINKNKPVDAEKKPVEKNK